MLAQAAGKIKALSPQLKGAFAKPFVATAEILRFPRDMAAERALEAPAPGRFTAYFTRSRREILKIQRLRYRIFSQEYGASFSAPFGLDRDRFDRHCVITAMGKSWVTPVCCLAIACTGPGVSIPAVNLI